MPLTVRSILKSLPKRSMLDSYGISTAHDFLKPLALSGSKKFDADWSSVLKNAKGQLVYTGRECEIVETKAASKSQTKGSIFEYTTVVTTTKSDRAGDVMEPEGGIIDKSMPVLWQHFPHEPCGKMIEVVEQSKSQIVVKNALIDTALGRDAAQLVEFGALRTSHGFRPIEFDPIPGTAKSAEEVTGWHVKTFEMLETSLVSVPCNTDAVITAFSRQKLCHPAVKCFAKGLHDGRIKIFKSTDVPKGESTVNINLNLGGNGRRIKASKVKTSEVKTKDIKPVTKAYIDGANFAGSWQAKVDALQEGLKLFLAKNGIMLGDDCYAYICVMFDTSAIVCVVKYDETASPSRKETLYQINWIMNGENPEWSGDLVPVEIAQSIVAKFADVQTKAMPESLRDLTIEPIKAGKVLSKKNIDRLTKAMAHCKEAIGCMDELHKEALGAMDDTLEGVQPTQPGQGGNEPEKGCAPDMDEEEEKSSVVSAKEMTDEDKAILEELANSALAV